MRDFLRRVRDGYIHFIENRGFPIIVTACVAVIAATALWTGKKEEVYISPAPPVTDNVSAAQLLQESLKSMSTPVPSPTSTLSVWLPPFQTVDILRRYSSDEFQQGSVTGVWQLHDSVDLACSPGEKVQAMADGLVLDAGKDEINGVWIRIKHADGIEALYAGMALSGAFQKDDHIRQGQTIGFAGSGPLDETQLPAHLHLNVTRNGTAIDPVSLWQ